MARLLIEHRVADYERWLQAFDSDLNADGTDGDEFRRKLGVRRYHVMRGADDPNLVLIDMEYDSPQQAEAHLDTMRGIWGQVEGKVIFGPQGRVVETTREREL
ncbi:hypothetical protein [Actinomycetospora sp. TBRC 11914]|uniref:hypothetical protein n=1 Tax=Actinomycetospora sp. TBRC 11914 TaxID=2729387 RepID=UPI00145EDB42|nr:hypothetical protein [Actinomycetospora sp. TBRC 11914]NMO91545.1 hypothetical protein [Actinomycetospora sp. TBRC 11914]